MAEAVMTPAMKAAAEAAKLPIEGIKLRPAAARPAAGDQVVALVSLVSAGDPTKQWLLRVQMAEAAGPASGSRDVTLYTSVGDAFVFHSAATAAMDLDIIGPVVAGQPYGAHRHRVAASPDFLGLDLDRAGGTMQRLGKVGQIGASGQPFPAAAVAAARGNLEQLGLSEADRRSFAGSLPALTEFFNLVRGTAGLEAILLQVIEKPSVLDVMHHGIHPDFNFEFTYAQSIRLQDLSGASPSEPRPGHLIIVDLQFYGKSVLTVALVVTAPQAPLEATAGIVGLVAWGPKHPERAVVVRTLATRFAPGP
jgi:hypothetical protein